MAQDFYGKDLAFKDDFIRSPTGDLDTISGLDNLKEAIIRRILTQPGSVIHRPTFGVGLKNFSNALNSISKQQQLALLIKEQLEQDPRIESFIGLRVEPDELRPGVVSIVVRVKPVGYAEQTVNVEEPI
jgi:hypothetical protein